MVPGHKHSSIPILRWWMIILCVAGFLRTGSFAADSTRLKSVNAPDDIFAATNVLHIRIKISPLGINRLRETTRPYRMSSGIDREPRPEVRGTVYEGDHTYTNVAIHLKGTAGSFRSIDDNPGLTLHFDKYVSGQTFHGYKKISLNNSVQDPSFLSERLSRETFERAGLPVARSGFATLELNGHYFGLRVMLEGIDRQFLKRYFKDVSGNVYDSGSVRDIDAPLAVILGKHRDDSSDLIRLRAARDKLEKEGMPQLEKVLDVDRFLRMIALEALLAHWDSYSIHRNNYRIFHDKDRGLLVFFPSGMDQVFGMGRGRSANISLFPRLEGSLAQEVLRTEEGRRRYIEMLAKLNREVFDAERLARRANQLAALVRPKFQELNPQWGNYYDEIVQELVNRIRQRSRNVTEQLRQLNP